MDWLWYTVAVMFVVSVFAFPLLVACRLWLRAEETDDGCCNECEGNICRPEVCDYCDSEDCKELYAPDLGGEHGH